MKNFDPLKRFTEHHLGHPVELSPSVRLTGDQVLEALWPLNAVFRSRFHIIRDMTYNPAYEPDADSAIEAFAYTPSPETWEDIAAGTWRVLLERHYQAITMATLQMHNPFMPVPADLPKRAWQGSALLFFYHGMELPFPVGDRSNAELPQPIDSANLRRH